MKKWSSYLVLLLTVSVVMISTSCSSAEAQKEIPQDPIAYEDDGTELAKGKEAPDFLLTSMDGAQVSLQDYRGKIIILNFWATWCPYCKDEMPDLDQAHQEIEDLVVLTVNVKERPETVHDYLKEKAFHFKVLLDPTGGLAKKYMANALPTSVFIDQQGRFLGNWPGLITREQLDLVLEEIRMMESDKGK